jgi:hypothetical protein
VSKSITAPNACSWSFAPGRVRVAMSDCSHRITVVDTKRMRVVRRIDAASGLGSLNALAWVRSDRLLAASNVDGQTTILAVDPGRGRVVRRVDLPLSLWTRGVFDGGVAVLLAPFRSFGPARVAVVDVDGGVRTATIDRISIGTVFESSESDPEGETRGAGFAVDPEGERAFVVAPNLLTAEVDLRTLDVQYHGPTREPSKLVRGPTRVAAWLGDGRIAVSGSDQEVVGTGKDRRPSSTPFGLHVVDTRTWTYRDLDPTANWFWRGDGVLLVQRGDPTQPRELVAWNLDGSMRYSLPLARALHVDVPGPMTYVCNSLTLVQVLATSTGNPVQGGHGTRCVELIRGAASPY